MNQPEPEDYNRAQSGINSPQKSRKQILYNVFDKDQQLDYSMSKKDNMSEPDYKLNNITANLIKMNIKNSSVF